MSGYLAKQEGKVGGGLVIRHAVSKIYLQAHVDSSTFGIAREVSYCEARGAFLLMIFSLVEHVIIEINACRNRPANQKYRAPSYHGFGRPLPG